MKALAAALLLGLAAPLGAQDQPAWRPVDAATGQIADVDGLEQLARDFPDSANVRLRLLNAQLKAAEADAALASLAWLAERGQVLGEQARAKVPAMIGERDAARASALLLSAATAIAASDIAATVPAEAGLVEAVISPVPDRFFVVTSITEKAVFMRSDDGVWQRLTVAGADDLSGILSDRERQLRWLASGNVDGSDDDEPVRSGLLRGIPVSDDWTFIPAPEGVTLSDLALGPDGAVYASDPLNGGIYTVAAGAQQIAVLVVPGTFRSPQGLAVSADGTRLYVSDYRYGLAVVDLATRAVSRLASAVPAALDGVDGLWLHGRELIAVQNGTSPMRISAFALSDDGARIIGYRVLEQAHPDWTEPLGGSIAAGALYYVATGQWDRYDRGKLRDGMTALPTVIRRLPLDQ